MTHIEGLEGLGDGILDDIALSDIVKYIKTLRQIIKYLKKTVTLLKDIAKDAAKRIGCEVFCELESDNIGNEINQRLPPCPTTSSRAKETVNLPEKTLS